MSDEDDEPRSVRSRRGRDREKKKPMSALQRAKARKVARKKMQAENGSDETEDGGTRIKKKNSRFGNAKGFKLDTDQSPRSRSNSPRSRSNSPRPSDTSDSEYSDVETPRAANGRKIKFQKEMTVAKMAQKAFQFTVLPSTEAIKEVVVPKRSASQASTDFGKGREVMQQQGFFAPKLVNATPVNVLAVSDRLKRTADADRNLRNLKPGDTVDKDVLRANLDSLQDNPSKALLTSVRTGDPIEEQFFEGNVRLLPNPLAPTRRGPTLPEEDEIKNPQYRAVRRRTQVDSNGRLRSRAPVCLEVGVKKMMFSKHPRFDIEDFFNAALLAEYHQYWRHMSADSLSYSLNRLGSFYGSVKNLFEDVREHGLKDNEHGDELVNLTMQQINFLSEAISNKRAGAQYRKNVYAAWSALKLQRKKQRYQSTPSVLQAHQIASLSQKYKVVEKMIKLVREIVDFMPEKFQAQAYDLETIKGNLDRVYDEVREEIKARQSKVDNIFRISQGNIDGEEVLLGKTNDEKVEKSESQRRRQINAETYFLKLFVNDQFIERTKDRMLTWPLFHINFNQSFTIQVTRRPHRIHMELWKKSMLPGMNKKIATIPISIPGGDSDNVSATALTPVDSYHQFSAEQPTLFRKDKSVGVQGPGARNARPKEGKFVAESVGTALMNEDKRNTDFVEHYTSGAVCCTVNWLASLGAKTPTETGELISLLPEKDFRHAKSRLIGDEIIAGSPLGLGTSGKFAKVLKGNAWHDPNDPSLEDVLGKKTDASDTETKKNLMFRLSRKQHGVEFSTSDRRLFKSSARENLLKMRSAVPHMFSGSGPIPFSDAEIKRDHHWRSLLKPSDKADTQEDDIEGADFDEQIILQRQRRIQGFVEKIQGASSGVVRRRHSHEASAFVKQGLMPEFKLDLSFLAGLFAPRRRLRPQPQTRKPEAIVRTCRLFLQVVRANNIPTRRDNSSSVGGRRDGSPSRRSPSPRRRQREEPQNDSEDKVDRLQPNIMVECSFQGHSVATTSQQGTTPSWGEAIYLPFQPNKNAGANSWTPDNLLLERDDVTVTLFDLTESQQRGVGKDKRKLTTIVSKRYLGSFSIPFTTIYLQQRVHGHFRVNTPLINLGYQTVQNEGTGRDTSALGTVKDRAANATTLHLMATLETPLVLPHDDVPEIRGGEDNATQKQARLFISRMKGKKMFKDREVMVLAPTLEGDMLLITKFLCPQAPPIGLTGQRMNTVSQVVRFVSLIPFLEDFQINQGQAEAWNYSHDFLQICAGDWEEHAVLLCNYFNYIDGNDYKSYLVIGTGIPEGKTKYVMRVSNTDPERDIVFWNASTGEGYAHDDHGCPLRVGTIASQDNIYANIQESDFPYEMNFNLNDPNSWRPFFSAKYPLPHGETCQIPNLEYTPPDTEFLERLERQIHQTIKEEFREWRGNKPMTQQTVLERELQQTLLAMEYERCGLESDIPFSDYEHTRMFAKYQKTSKLHGFPFNSSFTDIKSILEQIKGLDIHETQIPSTKFAFGVKCIGYPCGVISAWVYVATLEPL